MVGILPIGIVARRLRLKPGVSRTKRMDALNQAELQSFLATTGIAVADASLRIGRELSYQPSPRRLIVVHVGSDDRREYIARTVSIVLSSQNSWLLIPRFGPAAKLGSLTTIPEAVALSFGPSERDLLCTYLCTRDMTMGSVSQDIYLVAANGGTLVTWDHHTHDDGLSIALRDVQESCKLLADLNTFGAELEVFYTDG